MLKGFIFAVDVCQEMFRSFGKIEDSFQIDDFRTGSGDVAEILS